jgi:hypothetical protein
LRRPAPAAGAVAAANLNPHANYGIRAQEHPSDTPFIARYLIILFIY